jgi:hypothetical protein
VLLTCFPLLLCSTVCRLCRLIHCRRVRAWATLLCSSKKHTTCSWMLLHLPMIPFTRLAEVVAWHSFAPEHGATCINSASSTVGIDCWRVLRMLCSDDGLAVSAAAAALAGCSHHARCSTNLHAAGLTSTRSPRGWCAHACVCVVEGGYGGWAVKGGGGLQGRWPAGSCKLHRAVSD